MFLKVLMHLHSHPKTKSIKKQPSKGAYFIKKFPYCPELPIWPKIENPLDEELSVIYTQGTSWFVEWLWNQCSLFHYCEGNYHPHQGFHPHHHLRHKHPLGHQSLHQLDQNLVQGDSYPLNLKSHHCLDLDHIDLQVLWKRKWFVIFNKWILCIIALKA